MNSMRRLFAAFWLALALLMGQHGAQLHDLGHAFKAMDGDTQQQHPGSDTCDKCSLYAPFAGAAATFVAVLALVAATIISAFASYLPALSRTVVSSRSRAPPQFL
ncbi:MAG TPA: hypothetical protein VH301_02395 [Usitatibacter sp.]|jgi:hypothetical protein|nr:hypothetical protein [Usitatibacter sp.]